MEINNLLAFDIFLPTPVAELKAEFEKHPAFGYEFMTRLAWIIAQRFHHRTKRLIEMWGDSFEANRI